LGEPVLNLMNVNRSNGSTARSQFAIAIVGGGFTGATLAAQILRNSRNCVSVTLIERGACPGRGVAYGTELPEHLLNVRAGNMSAYADDPDHFLRWARLNHDPAARRADFLPRQAYGRYIASLLRQEGERHPGQFEYLQDEAVSLARTGTMAEIRLRGGRTVLANKVVLALGNFPPGDPPLPGKAPDSRRYVSDPWAATTPGDVAHASSILLVGSGLTSVDVAMALRRRGFSGTIHFLSRRGLLPQAHRACSSWPRFWNECSPKTVRGLVRLLRRQIEAAEMQGSDWRAVMDSVRPLVQAMWRSLPRSEQRRFLRHVRPYWDVHRHRLAPQIGAWLTTELASSQTQVHAGRITEYAEQLDAVDVTYRVRATGELQSLRVDQVINCTGPQSDCRKVDNAFLANLLQQKLARPDPLLMGLDVSPDGALIDAHGVASDLLYTLGPARMGSLWETIAVPEIRVQVAELSNLLTPLGKAEDVDGRRSEAIAGSPCAIR